MSFPQELFKHITGALDEHTGYLHRYQDCALKRTLSAISAFKGTLWREMLATSHRTAQQASGTSLLAKPHRPRRPARLAQPGPAHRNSAEAEEAGVVIGDVATGSS